MCMHVCAWIMCMHLCVCMYVYACMCMHVCVCMYVHACMCMHVTVCTYVCMHVYVWIYVWMYVSLYVNSCMYEFIHTCMKKLLTINSSLKINSFNDNFLTNYMVRHITGEGFMAEKYSLPALLIFLLGCNQKHNYFALILIDGVYLQLKRRCHLAFLCLEHQ